ncbi:MAG: type II secretion system F family protein [bacterium]
MRTFAYKGFDASGAVRRGLIEALDLRDARGKLAERGLLAETVNPSESISSLHKRGGTFKAETRAFVYRELGVLLTAGMPLVSAIEMLIQSPELAEVSNVLAGVRDRVRDGAPLAAAVSDAGREVTALEQAILEVGERSGGLGEMLEKLAGFLEEEQRLRERIVSAMIYPCIILSFAMIVATIMLGVVIPSAGKVLMAQSRVPLPMLTRVMMTIGQAMIWVLPLAIAFGVAGGFSMRRRLRRDADYRMRWDRRLYRLPVVGRGRRLVAGLRCSRTLAVLLRGGVPLVDAVRLAGRATGSAWLGSRVMEEGDALRHGRSLADVFRRVPVLSEMLPAWIQAGEASGSLERMLECAGDAFQHRWERFITRALGVMEPLLILVIGGFVLLVVLSIILPIVSMNKAMG